MNSISSVACRAFVSSCDKQRKKDGRTWSMPPIPNRSTLLKASNATEASSSTKLPSVRATRGLAVAET